MLICQSFLLLGSAVLSTLAATNTTSAWPPYSPTSFPIFALSSDSQMAFYLEEVMSMAQGAGSNTGEVLRIATQMVPNDFESVYDAFYPMAEAIYAIAESVNATKDPVAARESYFHASSYYRGASFFMIGNQSDPRIYSTWDQQLDSFNKAIALLEVPGERLTVRAQNSSIGPYDVPLVVYKASNSNDKTPTIVLGSGYDASQEESYHTACTHFLRRGMNCPGQPTTRRNQQIGFIPDWWTAATPVVDYLSTRLDVDMSKLALGGLSFGGSLAPIAASHEHRFSAVMAIDGLYSVREAFAQQFPTAMTALYAAGNVTGFNELVHAIQANATYASSLRWILDQSLWAFNTTSPYDWYTRLGDIVMTTEIVAELPMPVFVAKGQNDVGTEQEPEKAYQMLVDGRPDGGALTTYHEFLTELGAGEHCSVGAETQLWGVALDWLGNVWGGMVFERLN